MSERISAYVNGNKTISIKGVLPTIYQYSASDYYLDVEFENDLAQGSIVYVMFRRSDGKSTSYLPMSGPDSNNVYSLKLDSDWYFYTAGNLTFTIKATRVNIDNGVQTTANLAMANYNLYINPSAEIYTPSPLPPSAYDIINNDINNIENNITSIEENIDQIEQNVDRVEDSIQTKIDAKFSSVNPVTHVTESLTEPDISTAHVSVTTYDGRVDDINIDLPEGLATEIEVSTMIEQSLTDLNPVVNIQQTDTPLQIKSIKKDNTTSDVNISLPADLVSFTDLEAVSQPEIEVYHATSADTALLADRATLADTATLANRATVADRATISDTALLANRATLADTATQDGAGHTISEYYQPLITQENKISYSLVNGLSTVASTGRYINLIDKPEFAEVAMTGSYYDLFNTPAVTYTVSSGSNSLITSGGVYNAISAINTNSSSFIEIDIPTAGVSNTGDISLSSYISATTALTGKTIKALYLVLQLYGGAIPSANYVPVLIPLGEEVSLPITSAVVGNSSYGFGNLELTLNNSYVVSKSGVFIAMTASTPVTLSEVQINAYYTMIINKAYAIL